MSGNSTPVVWTKFRLLFSASTIDVTLVAGYLVAGTSVLLTDSGPQLVRGAVGFPLLFFVPGYSLLALLFPGAGPLSTDHRLRVRGDWFDEGLVVSERLLLSFGVSISLLPLVCIALVELEQGLVLDHLLAVLGTLSGCCLAVGAIRRSHRPRDEQFRMPITQWHDRLRRSLFDRTRLQTVLYVALVGAVLLVVATLVVGLLSPAGGASYTGMTILTRNETGAYVAGGYTAAGNGSRPFVVEIENHREPAGNYTVFVYRQDDPGRTLGAVASSDRVAVLHTTVSANQTRYLERSLHVRATGDTRLVFLLYRGTPPAAPSLRSADRSAYVWLNESSATGS
ncbi:MAG: DUF1616 domain-containing protein [Halorientalis sp.]